MLKVGVVGAGYLGKIHLKLLHQSKKFHLVGFYDCNFELGKKIEYELGYIYFSNLNCLLAQIEVLDIVTPTFSHFFFAKKAIQYNLHFFIEKSVTKTLEEVDELIELLKGNNLKAQVGHVERFNPAFSASIPFINNPKFIEIHRLARFNHRGTDVSVVLDLMIHDLDIVLSVINSDIIKIDASGVSVVSKNFDIVNARIEFENGTVANFTTSRISMKNMRKCRFFQKNAYISIDFLKLKTEIIRIKLDSKNPYQFDLIIENFEGEKNQFFFEYPNIIHNNPILDELESFYNAIVNDIPVKVSLLEARNSLEIALKIIKKIKS